MSNPFDEPIQEKLKKSKTNSRISKVSKVSNVKFKVKEIIILDSSEESNVEMSKESGEISERLHNEPVGKIITSVVTQVNEVVGDDVKDKQLNESKQRG